MPSLVVYNPPGEYETVEVRVEGEISKKVIQLRYEHKEDGQNYYHDFAKGVKMLAVVGLNSERQILLVSDNDKPLWEDLD